MSLSFLLLIDFDCMTDSKFYLVYNWIFLYSYKYSGAFFSGVQLNYLKIYCSFRSCFKYLEGRSGVVLTPGLIILCCWGKTLLCTLPNALWMLRFAGNYTWLWVGLGQCCFLLFSVVVSSDACAYQYSAEYWRGFPVDIHGSLCV